MKRYYSSWVLLAVFLPMLALSSLHVHPEAHLEEGYCKECVHHLPHAGHFGSQTTCSFDCVLCQFLTLPFLVAPVVVFVFNLKFSFVPFFVSDQRVVCNMKGANHLRAPPFLMS